MARSSSDQDQEHDRQRHQHHEPQIVVVVLAQVVIDRRESGHADLRALQCRVGLCVARYCEHLVHLVHRLGAERVGRGLEQIPHGVAVRLK